MWFTRVSEVEEPGRRELVGFVNSVVTFLRFVLQHPTDFAFLWRDRQELLVLALQTFVIDVERRGRAELRNAIPEISDAVLELHGLVGRPARFKFRVLNSISNQWRPGRGQVGMRRWFKQTADAIDVILGSLVDAAGGAGGIIKEFKDALSALAG